MPDATPSGAKGGAFLRKNKTLVMVLGAGALGIVAYAWYKNRQSTPSTSPSAVDYTGAGQVPSQDQFIPPYQQFGTSGGVDLSQLPPMDNPAWAQRVQALLVDIGYDPGMVANTVGKYLNRQTLTGPEQALIQAALAYTGPPPFGQFSINTTPLPAAVSVPPPKPTTAPPKFVLTGNYGTPSGHPIDEAYLIGAGWLKSIGGKLYFTGKGGTPRNHPYDEQYALGIRFLRRA